MAVKHRPRPPAGVQPFLFRLGYDMAVAVTPEAPEAPGITAKQSGRILTPEPLAQALCEWAIRSPADGVLDLGVGEGAFAIAAVETLRQRGADAHAAAVQLHGAEWDRR